MVTQSDCFKDLFQWGEYVLIWRQLDGDNDNDVDDNVIEMMTMIKMMKMMLAYSSQPIASDKAVYTYEVSYIGGRAKCTPRTKRGGHCHLASRVLKVSIFHACFSSTTLETTF